MSDSKYDLAFINFRQKYRNEIGSIGKVLGKGHFGEVRDIKYKNKAMAVKIMEKSEDDKLNGEILATNIRNHNIIKIQKIYENEKFEDTYSSKDSRDKSKDKKESKKKEKNYDFIIMEKAIRGMVLIVISTHVIK